ncbi:MAG TPA: acetyl-CoA carboxylase biotin carboxyl carrier protein [Polyangia bacterium]|jgi:acetyl-CoA carboxylase biotin carboxyl carrier protein|nr:acetyl-CoA carboxylase biotin carboxyl carrier protein [Polyangia bacterium]HWE27149.1 acetyl-CoA carboxylase biotin carboxyl carrier protein [Polyangia bacterium]
MKAKSKKAARAVASRTSSASHASPPVAHAPHGVEARIDSLAEILRRHELNELEIEEGGVRIYMRRGGDVVTTAHHVAPAIAPAIIAPHAAPPTASGALPPAVHSTDTSDGNVLYVTSPFVGTFYRSPSPDTSAFVDVGTRIKKGQVLCIVEAMKLMNEIESEIEGAIVQILVENGQAVEYGEPLFKIKQG